MILNINFRKNIRLIINIILATPILGIIYILIYGMYSEILLYFKNIYVDLNDYNINIWYLIFCTIYQYSILIIISIHYYAGNWIWQL